MTWIILLAAAAGVVAAVRLFLYATIGRRGKAQNRTRRLRWRVRMHLRPGPGFASLAELVIRWGHARAIVHGKRGRPGIPLRARLLLPPTALAVRYGRAQYGYVVYGRLEDQVLVLGPPRSGKSGIVADRIIDHPGPVLATTSRPDLWNLTSARRSLRGPVHAFNPQAIGGIPSTFAWNLLDGCEDPAVAFRRAAALVGGVHKHADMAFWLDKSAAALAALMHAGALDHRTILDVFAWTNRHGDERPNEILAADPRGSKTLLSTLAEIQRDNSRPGDSIRITMSRSLSWVAIPAIAAAVTPGPAAGLDIADFLTSNGTLYLIATDTESSPVAPLFRALACEVHYVAGLNGSTGPAGRLDPPVLFGLDEVAQVAPVPLPEWLSDSAGKGILICAVAHGLSQLETRWGKEGAQTIWATSGVKILFGGMSEADTLDYVSRLCGTIDVHAGDGYDTVRVLPPELLEKLPEWRALVLRTNLSPCVVKIRLAWKRRGLRHVPECIPQPAPAAQGILALPEYAPPPVPVMNGNGHRNGNGNGHAEPAWLRDLDDK